MTRAPKTKKQINKLKGGGLITVNPRETAKYIADMCGELAVMAERSGLLILGYILTLAASRASSISCGEDDKGN
jgi:hypothetical protein